MTGRRHWRGIDSEPGWINRKFQALEAQIRELRAAKGLEASSVAGGVVTVKEILTNPTGPIQFINTDTATCSADGATIEIPLSRVPKAGSEQVFYNGLPLKRADWTRTDTSLTIPGEAWFRAGRIAWVDYAYDGTAALIGPVITSPANDSSVTDSTPTISGTAAALRDLEVFVDDVSVGTTTSDSAGAWTLTVAAALTVGLHTISVIQTEPDGTQLSAVPVIFSVVTVTAAFDSKTTITGDQTSIALPGTSTAGDLLVLVLHARDTAACSDPRFTLEYTDGARWGIWVGTDDGSGNPVAITLSSPSGGGLDGCGALARITGAPLLPVSSEQTSGASGVTTFAPTMPTLGSFGVVALVSGTTLTSGFINDDSLGYWTTRASVKGGGSGLTQVLIATSPTGPTSGQWSNTGGSSAGWGAWVGGLQ